MTFPASLPLGAIGTGSALRFVANDVPQAAEQLLAISIVTGVANQTSAVTVAAAQVTANTAIIPFLNTVGGTVGALPAVQTITAGTGFTFKASASDTSTYSWLLIG
jgi:hypothetical protein